MKNRTVQILVICLSAATLSGPVSLTAYAQSLDSETDTKDEPLETVAVEEESVADAETIAYEACDATEEAQEASQTAVNETADALVVLENEQVSEEEAQTIVDGVSTTVDAASEELTAAEDKFNQLVSEYDKAKQEYENAVLAYALERQVTQDSLQEAEQGLQESEARLHQLEQQIEDAKELIYEYTDADGQTVQVSEEEAEALNGQVKIADYWTVDGSYVPRYVDYMIYTGTRNTNRYSDKSAQQSGKQYVIDKYENNSDYYKTSIQFNDDWDSEKDKKSRTYETSGSFTASYNKVSEKDGYAVSDTVKEGHYVSEAAAIGAVINEARNLHGAQTIDEQESNLSSVNVKEFSQIVKNYVYLGGDEAAYKMLLADANQARSQLEAAKEKVKSIQDKLDSLKDDDSVLALVQVTFLEAKLETATSSYNKAKDNLEVANKNLQDVKAIYANKYQQASKEDEATENTIEEKPSEDIPAESNTSEEIVPQKAPSEEKILDDKTAEDTTKTKADELEEKKTELEKTPIEEKKASTGTSSSQSSSEEAPLIKLPSTTEIKEIIDNKEQELTIILPFLNHDNNHDNSSHSNSHSGDSGESNSVLPKIDSAIDKSSVQSEENITIPDATTPKDVTVSGLIQRKKWFVGLAGVSAVGGIGIGIFEFKRRAIAKILDKLNQ